MFHVFFFPSSPPLLILPELTPRDRGFPFDVADTHFLRRQTNKPHHRHHRHPPTPQKNPLNTAVAPVIDRRTPQICSAALPGPGEARRGGGRDKTGNQKEASRDQASSKADLISSSEVLEMSLMCWWRRGCERRGGRGGVERRSAAEAIRFLASSTAATAAHYGGK